MGINYGSLPCTFYRDFERHKTLEPSNAIGGPITFSRASQGTYIGSDGYLKTASANEPRFGYEYDSNNNLVYRGLLIEEGTRNNHILYSEDFTQSVWTKTNSSVSSTSVVNPEGVSSSQKVSLSSAGGGISQTYTTSYTNGNTSFIRCFHASIMVKPNECGYLAIQISNGTDSMVCYFDVTNGATGSNGANANNLVFLYKHIVNMGGGWYRCVFAVRDDNLTNKTYTFSYLPTTSNNSLTINASGNGMYCWGAMVHYEVNTSINYNQNAKSYTKTTYGIGYQNADSCYVGGASYTSRFCGTKPNTELTLFGQFSMPSNLKTGIVQRYMGIGVSSITGPYFRQSVSNCNILFRSAIGYDYGSFPILDDNNKGIVAYGAGLGSKGCLNGSYVANSNPAAQSITSSIVTINLYGDAYYKKIFCVPSILRDRHIQELTKL